MSTSQIFAFDKWIRSRFKDLNTELEEFYFGLENPAAVEGHCEQTKTALCDEGRALIASALEAATLPTDEEAAYDILGNIGLYMAALRRHEMTNPDREQRSPFPEASALAQKLAVGLGVMPRFATAHVNLRNLAHSGYHKSFTWLKDEQIFITYNCLSILGYIRAADVLRRIVPLGVTHPVSVYLLQEARRALLDVAAHNKELDEKLDVRRFFYNIRPYFKSYRVGRTEYRGANAGDFAAINEIDLQLGLCRTSDASYASVMLEKIAFMTAEDQQILQRASRRTSLLDCWLAQLDQGPIGRALQPSLSAFISVCEAHGFTAAQHHDLFVKRFIEAPAVALEERDLKQITASGPPLQVVVNALAALRDRRLAVDRDDIDTRHADLERLRAASRQAVIGR
ncbi:monodechloroaminopyrrolnitrin synthase PrnB family protein [Paraburkholderia sp.]|uniref:monodechloroaminopyrrolnitrin synthase PrnB family protein n=1 Tax=Paraburkholderia sp. TaxID=1926495 RepID=UPI003D6E8C01